ncbi:GTPase family protein [Xenorhabdus bovienii]|uniref:GTPase family protein n=1 Tax=Xenorhabdus bovienii TaxID=40576 RepID=UPI00237CD946|nr:GTPase [Xenorhabdus bovienii]
MSDSTLIGQIPEVTKQSLSRLPGVLSDELVERLLQCVHYEPVIGIMGKSGAGKSSLCNTLFSPPPANVDAVKGCTRRAQQYKTSDGLHALNIIDFPGIGETPTLDKMYARLYQHWLNKLDLIVWVLKADDRAWNDDIRCYRQLVSQGAKPAHFLFVLNQADKIELCREWDTATHQPSMRQQQNLQEKVTQVNTERLAQSACPVVTKILQRQGIEEHCIRITDIKEEVAGRFYQAQALLNTGSKEPLTIEVRSGGNIYVTLTEQE